MTTFWSALMNGAVLSSLFSLAVWLVLHLTPRRRLNAATRYAIWWIVLAITLSLPLTYANWRAGKRDETNVPARMTSGFEWQQPLIQTAPPAVSLPITIPASRWLRPLLAFWIAVSLLLLVRVFLSYAALYCRRARATAAPPTFEGSIERWLGKAGSTRQRVRLAVSDEIEIPMATGPLSPAILIPATLLEALSVDDLEQIGLHEAAHLARYDDYALFVQRIVEALFSLHPVVRWVARQIDLEREIACDDVVAGSGESARGYADCLTRAVALCGGVRPLLAAANVADSRSHLSQRVELLLQDRGLETGLNRSNWALVAVALIGTATLLTKTPATIAFAAAPQPPVLRTQEQAPPVVPRYEPAPSQSQSPFEARRSEGLARLKARQFDTAIAIFQDLLSETTDLRVKAHLWALLGEAYRDKGDFAKSLQVMELAFQQLPENANIVTNLALLYEATKDYVHARQYYEKAIGIDPNNPVALNNLAYILTLTGGDLDLALTYARTAQQKLPNSIEVNDTIGWVYLKKGMIDDAVGSFRLLTQQAPQNPEFHYHLALALYQKADLPEAMDECKTALTGKPAPEMQKDIRQLMEKIAPKSDPPMLE